MKKEEKKQKRCKGKCKKLKSIKDDFYHNNKNADNLHSECKVCYIKKVRVRIKNRKEERDFKRSIFIFDHTPIENPDLRA